MGFYNVVRPCVVGKLHYARPTSAPIEVDDDVAAPLVESGCLEPYRPGGITGETGTVLDGDLGLNKGLPAVADGIAEMVSRLGERVGQDFVAEVPDDTAEPKPRRGRRKATED